jgi:hypothetical protein
MENATVLSRMHEAIEARWVLVARGVVDARIDIHRERSNGANRLDDIPVSQPPAENHRHPCSIHDPSREAPIVRDASPAEPIGCP